MTTERAAGCSYKSIYLLLVYDDVAIFFVRNHKYHNKETATRNKHYQGGCLKINTAN
jgi:hypothetical protein